MSFLPKRPPIPATFQRSVSPAPAQAGSVVQTKRVFDVSGLASAAPPRARPPEVPQVFHPRTAVTAGYWRAPAVNAPRSPTLPGVAVQAKLAAGRGGLTQASSALERNRLPAAAVAGVPTGAVRSGSPRVNTKPIIQRSALPGQMAAPPLEPVLTASEEDTRIVRELLRVPTMKAQWDQMIRVGGPISIVTRMDVVGEAKGERGYYRPNWNPATRTITIPQTYAGLDRVSILSFELHNAFNGGGTGAPTLKAQHMSREEYAIGMESFEYKAVSMHHENMRQGVEHLGWDPHVDRFRGNFGPDPMLPNWNTVDGYLATQNNGGRPGSHTDAYRRNWDVLSTVMDQSE